MNLFERNKQNPKCFQATYTVRENIGNGSFAQVRRARHRSSWKEVALKVFDKTKLGPSAIDDAHKEFEILRKLDHQNVLKNIDMFESPQTLVLVLPLMKSTLQSYLTKLGKAVDEEHAKHIFKKIVSAVEHCHQQGLMHCDLKLENILVNYDDSTMDIHDVCIADFGLSCKIKTRSTDGEGAIFGTLPYMAPEMLFSDSTFDDRIDAWALGIILHELLTFEAPFHGDTDEELASSIRDDEIDFFGGEVFEALSVEAIDLIDNLLQKDPFHRLTVHELARQSWLLP